jgi:hypothetical protein
MQRVKNTGRTCPRSTQSHQNGGGCCLRQEVPSSSSLPSPGDEMVLTKGGWELGTIFLFPADWTGFFLLSPENCISGHSFFLPWPVLGVQMPCSWIPIPPSEGGGWHTHVCQMPAAVVHRVLGVLVCWLMGKTGEKKVRFSFFSDVWMYCHWLSLGSLKPVMETCFRWQGNTVYIHIQAYLLFGRCKNFVALVLATSLSLDPSKASRPDLTLCLNSTWSFS